MILMLLMQHTLNTHVLLIIVLFLNLKKQLIFKNLILFNVNIKKDINYATNLCTICSEACLTCFNASN